MGFKSGLVTLIGKPNVGKSTLLNALVGQKVSIVSSRPQTTRRKVIGFAQGESYQIGFIDTPGMHEPHNRLGRAMVEQARAALADVDVVVAVVDVSKKPDDLDVSLAKLMGSALDGATHRMVCLNKMDLLAPELVVERVGTYCKLFQTEDYMFTNAARGENLGKLLEMVLGRLPESEPLFPEDEYTDQSTRFLVSELIREKVLLKTRQELPHATAVRVDNWVEDDEKALLSIAAVILVERPTQRAIILGKQGSMIKAIGTEARQEIEKLLGKHVYLDLHVSVKEDWRSNSQMLRELEYTE